MTHRTPMIEWLEKNKDNLPKGKVLEFGYGNKDEFKNWFTNEGFEWTGLDKEPIKGILHMNIEDIEFKEEFDVIFSCHTFEHCENPIKVLRKIKEALKPHGKLIMATPLCTEDQILEGSDKDHIFVLNEWQLQKILFYTGFHLALTGATGEHTRRDSIITVGGLE